MLVNNISWVGWCILKRQVWAPVNPVKLKCISLPSGNFFLFHMATIDYFLPAVSNGTNNLAATISINCTLTSAFLCQNSIANAGASSVDLADLYELC